MRFQQLIIALLLIILSTLGLHGWVDAQDGGGRGNGTPTPGNRLFYDDFGTFVNRWTPINEDGTTVSYTNQNLQFLLENDEREALSQPNNDNSYSRFIVATTLSFDAMTANDSLAGIVFGYQNASNYYVFGMQPTGHYRVELKLDGEWQTVPLVRGYFEPIAGDQQRYELMAQYDTGLVRLAINGQPLVPFYTDTLDEGTFGLYARTVSGGARINFDEFAVYDLIYVEASDSTTPMPEVTTPPMDEATPTPEMTPVPTQQESPPPSTPSPTPSNGETVPPPRI